MIPFTFLIGMCVLEKYTLLPVFFLSNSFPLFFLAKDHPGLLSDTIRKASYKRWAVKPLAVLLVTSDQRLGYHLVASGVVPEKENRSIFRRYTRSTPLQQL
jgi:hypothetical protein